MTSILSQVENTRLNAPSLEESDLLQGLDLFAGLDTHENDGELYHAQMHDLSYAMRQGLVGEEQVESSIIYVIPASGYAQSPKLVLRKDEFLNNDRTVIEGSDHEVRVSRTYIDQATGDIYEIERVAERGGNPYKMVKVEYRSPSQMVSMALSSVKLENGNTRVGVAYMGDHIETVRMLEISSDCMDEVAELPNRLIHALSERFGFSIEGITNGELMYLIGLIAKREQHADSPSIFNKKSEYRENRLASNVAVFNNLGIYRQLEATDFVSTVMHDMVNTKGEPAGKEMGYKFSKGSLSEDRSVMIGITGDYVRALTHSNINGGRILHSISLDTVGALPVKGVMEIMTAADIKLSYSIMPGKGIEIMVQSKQGTGVTMFFDRDKVDNKIRMTKGTRLALERRLNAGGVSINNKTPRQVIKMMSDKMREQMSKV